MPTSSHKKCERARVMIEAVRAKCAQKMNESDISTANRTFDIRIIPTKFGLYIVQGNYYSTLTMKIA